MHNALAGRIALPLILLIMTVLLSTNVSLADTPESTTYTNPVIDRDCPDPGVLETDGAYWMTHTMGGPDVGCPLYRSPDLIHWTFVSHLLTGENKQPWMNGSYWAPEIHRIVNGKKPYYLLTFTAMNAETGHLCIEMATASAIIGPYTMSPQPIIRDTVTVLDSDVFQDTDGKVYLLWKRDSEVQQPVGGQGVGGTILLRELNPDGITFAAGSAPIELLTGHPDTTDPAASWERGLVEAPWLLKHGSCYYLIYSGAFIDTSYAIGVARSSSPTGPFVRCPGNPILRSNATWGGPGHGGFVRDRVGVEWHIYHARHQDRPNYGRVQMLDRIYWTNDWPAFGTGGTPSSEPQTAPTVHK